MAELRGHAIATLGRRLDHTYVTSSDGHAWPCGGRAEGGDMISKGCGSSWLASCLAGADQTAGIRYGITGVCHQIANRILRPAGVDVSRAWGDRISQSLWRKYGRNASADGVWPEWNHCSDLAASAGLRDEGVPFVSGSTSSGGPPGSQPGRLDRMIDEHLGVDYAPARRTRLRQLDALAEQEQDELVRALDEKRLTPEQYLERFTRMAGELFERYEEVLGRDDFVRLFGAAPEDALDIADPEAFRRAHGAAN